MLLTLISSAGHFLQHITNFIANHEILNKFLHLSVPPSVNGFNSSIDFIGED